MPDGRVIKLGGERFEAPEILFQPHLTNCEGVGIADKRCSNCNICKFCCFRSSISVLSLEIIFASSCFFAEFRFLCSPSICRISSFIFSAKVSLSVLLLLPALLVFLDSCSFLLFSRAFCCAVLRISSSNWNLLWQLHLLCYIKYYYAYKV